MKFNQALSCRGI